MLIRQRRTLVLLVTAVLIVGGLSFTAAFSAHAISRQLHAWKVLPEPERLTELYFNNHTALPTKYVPGQAQNISFTTHDIEYAATGYTYTVTEQNEAGSQSVQLARSSFQLNQNQYHTTALALTPADLGSRAKITITLSFREPQHYANTQQSVDYWVNE